MRNTFNIIDIIGTFIVGFCFCLLCIDIKDPVGKAEKRWQAEAVKRGFGQMVVSTNAPKVFEWNTPTNH